jgi:hypothetical protein
MKTFLALVIATSLVLTACGGSESAAVGDAPTATPAPAVGATGTVHVVAESGNHCPVINEDNATECADRPVADAVVVVLDATGVEVARGITGVDGTVSIEVPFGDYTVVAQPIDGYMNQPGPWEVTITGCIVEDIRSFYDTGIA